MTWFVGVLKSYPEIAIFLSLAIGFVVGSCKVGGFSLGGVTGTLLAGVVNPAPGYGAPYAVGNTLLIVCGLLMVLLLH